MRNILKFVIVRRVVGIDMDEVEFVEKYFGVKLHWYQKILFKIMYKKPKYDIYCSRGNKKWSREVAEACMRLNESKL